MIKSNKRIKNYYSTRIFLTSFLLTVILLPSSVNFLNVGLLHGNCNELEYTKTTSQNTTFDTLENATSKKPIPITMASGYNGDNSWPENPGEFLVDVDFFFEIRFDELLEARPYSLDRLIWPHYRVSEAWMDVVLGTFELPPNWEEHRPDPLPPGWQHFEPSEWLKDEDLPPPEEWPLPPEEWPVEPPYFTEWDPYVWPWRQSGTFKFGSTNLVPCLQFYFYGDNPAWAIGIGDYNNEFCIPEDYSTFPVVPFRNFLKLRVQKSPFGFEEVNFGSIQATVHRNAYVDSITYNETYIEGNNDFKVYINLNKNNASDVNNVQLERKESGDWQIVHSWGDIDFEGKDQKTLTFIEDGSLNPTGDNQQIFYRVLMEGSHFRYRSEEGYRIMVNPTKPFISEFSIILEHEFYDKGVINPTEVFSIEGNITNPMDIDIPNVDIVFNRYLSGLEEWCGVTKDVGTLTAGQKKEFFLMTSDFPDITPSDTPYLIPGWDYSPDIELKTWEWCNLDTGGIRSISKKMLFNIWIQGDEDDTKLTMNLTAYVPNLKIIYAKELNRSYRSLYQYINDLNSVKGFGGPLLGIGIGVNILGLFLGGPVGLVVEVVGLILDGLGVYLFCEEDYLEKMITVIQNSIQEYKEIIKDPPDPNIFDVVDIEFEPIDPLAEEFAFAKNLYDSYTTYSRFKDITRAIKITNDRYMYAILNGEYSAAKLQADALKDFTQLQTNYYNSYLMNLEGVLNNFTFKEIITNNGYEFDEAVHNFTFIKEIFLNNIEDPELRQLFIDKGYTNEDIDEITTTISNFDLNTANQETEQLIDEFNHHAKLSASNGTEIIEGLISGVEELTKVPETPEFRVEFKTTSSQYMEIMELQIDSTKKEVDNGETLAFNFTLSNLLEQSTVYNIKIERLNNFKVLVDDIEMTPNGMELLLDALETREILVEIEIPINKPPVNLNPEVITSTVYMEKKYIKSQSILISVNDDDITPPLLLLSHKGDSTDEKPGIVELDFRDPESEATAEISIIGPNNFIYMEDYLIEGVYSLDLKQISISELGEYCVILSAENNDEDGWDGDEETNSISISFIIEDDDIEPPNLYNLLIDPDPCNITLSFDVIDESGISEIFIYVKGEQIKPLFLDQLDNTFIIVIPNYWIFLKDPIQVEITVKDGDNDRENDMLISHLFGTFKSSLFDMYEYVNWQIVELKIFIENTFDFSWKRCLIYKLTKAQENLGEAFDLIQNNNITQGLCYDFVAKIFLRITEIKTELLNRKNWIPDETADYIITALHSIRNNIVILMGASTGSELAYEIAYIEVDLLNLNDYIEEELPYCVGKYLSRKIWCASKLLEIAIFRISEDEEIDCLLRCARWKLERTIQKIDCLLEKGKISEAQASYLKGEILEIITKIESLNN